jgi:phosphate acetyltransferase
MYWMNLFTESAKKNPLSLILSEGNDPRVISAAYDIHSSGISKKVSIVGNEEVIQKTAAEQNINLAEIEIVDPEKHSQLDKYAARLMELRSTDFSTIDEALKKVQDPLVFGTLLHEDNYADIHISGAVNTSADVIRSFFHIIKSNRKEGIAASFFFMDNLGNYGEKGAMLFADCAVNINPGTRQLARIANQTGKIAKKIFGFNTHLSLLSYSTKGSGAGDQVDAVLEVGKELEKLKPEFVYEVEMQADSAIVPDVSERKAPGNSIMGKSNVLIFPDLQSGNIAYKLVERIAGAKAYGPIMVGLNKTATDLSRGCSRQDILGTFLVASYFHHRKHLITE